LYFPTGNSNRRWQWLPRSAVPRKILAKEAGTMALINTVTPAKAEGIIKEGYDMFMQKAGIIPRPMEMMSASPALFELQLKRIHYFSTHPRLGFALLAHIRYLVAQRLEYRFCTDFNAYILKKVGVDDATFEKMKADPGACLLEDNDKAMLVFVMKAIKAPGSVTAGDIVDALAQGVSMIDHSIMMQAFQMDQNCMAG
jgi:hypothetical protein